MAIGPDIYSGSELHGVFRLTAGSGRWEPAGKRIPKTEIHCLMTEGGDLFAGTGGGVSFHIGDISKDQFAQVYHGPGVFLSEDRGVRWKPVNSGLRRAPDVPGLEKLLDLWIESLAVCGPYLFAGTQNGEIWRLPLSDLK